MSGEEGVPFLTKIPFSMMVSMSLDDGEPFTVKYPESEEARALEKVIEAVRKHCEGITH
jgi:MinD superfamily P-loop ATPase